MSGLALLDIDELLTLENVAKKDGRNVTEKDLSVIKHAGLLIQNGKVQWVGESHALVSELKRSGAKIPAKSMKGCCVLPAFTECHTHTVFGGSRSAEFEMRVQGASYQEIAKAGGGILSTVGATRKAPTRALVERAQFFVDEFLKQGVTTLELKSGYGLSKSSELAILRSFERIQGPRVVSTYLGLHAFSPDFADGEAYLKEVLESTLPEIAQQKLTLRADAFVEKDYFSVEQAKRYFEKAKSLGMRPVVHADQLTRSGGAALAVEVGADSADHLVHVDAADIRNLAQSSVTCVLLPASDFYLKINYPPARAMIDAGARVALSTDFNPGSAPTVSLTLVGLLARLEMKMTLPEVIAAYTYGSAAALKLQDSLGSLQVGKWADFVVTRENWRDLFYQIGVPSISEVWKTGKKLKLS